MRKFLLLIFVNLFICSTSFAQPSGKGFVSATEVDGSPDCYGYQLKFANGNVTDGGDGTCSVADQTGAGGGDEGSVNSTVVTNFNFLDNLYIDWALDTVPAPDDITSKFNYAETLAGNPALLTTECIFMADGLMCEGTTADAIEMKLAFPDPTTTDKTLTLPNATDTLIGKDTTDTLTNKTMTAAANVIDADTAVALAADPADCGANTFANVIAASGALTCAAIADADVPNTITIDNATTAANLGADGVDALTEIAQAIKTAANDTSPLVIGTAGSNGEIAKWNTDGTLTDSNVIIGTLTDTKFCTYTAAGTVINCTSAGGGESTTVSDTTTVNLTLTGADITADGLYTAGDNLTLTLADFDLDAAISLATSVTSPIFASNNADPADAGIVRLGNAESIAWEAAPAGTDITLSVDASEIMQVSGALNAVGAITGSNLSGTNTGDNTVATSGDSATSFFATGTLEVAIGGTGTTTSTGTGAVVLGTSPTITTSLVIPQGGLSDDSIREADLMVVDAAGDEECLTYETTTGDFEWQTCGGGADTNAVKEYWWPASSSLPLNVVDSIPPISKDTGTNIDQLTVDFDDSTDECRTVSFKVPSDVTSGSTITFRWHWYSAAATSGNAILEIRHNGGVAEGTDPDQALTVVAAAADATQGTAGMLTATAWTETLANLGWVANEQVDAEFCRDANNASDTLVGDLKTTGFGVEIPRS